MIGTEMWQYESAEDEIQRLRAELSQKNAAAQAFSDQVDLLQRQITEMKASEGKTSYQARTMREQNKALTEEAEMLRDVNAQLSSRVESLELAVKHADIAAENKVAVQVRKLQDEIADLKSQVANYKGTVKQRDKEVADKNEKLTRQKEEIARLNGEVYSLSTDLAKANRELTSGGLTPVSIPESVETAAARRAQLTVRLAEIQELLTDTHMPVARHKAVDLRRERVTVQAELGYLKEWIRQRNFERGEAERRDQYKACRDLFLKYLEGGDIVDDLIAFRNQFGFNLLGEDRFKGFLERVVGEGVAL